MSFNLKGGPELLAFLDQLPAKMANNVLRGGMRAGAKVLQKGARERVRKKSGLLAKSIKIGGGVRDGVITARVMTTGPHSYLARFIEHGVAPHFISIDPEQATEAGQVPRISKGARKGAVSIGMTNQMVKRGSLVINGKFVGDTVHHPGIGRHPFMRLTLDEDGQAAVNAVGRYVAGRLKIGDLSAPVLEAEEEA